MSEAATELLQATLEAREVERISAKLGEFSVDDAYRIQRKGMLLRQGRGERWIGWKMGLTSEAKRKQMSLDAAIFGYLHDQGRVNSKVFSLNGLIHPKVEPEIGFRLKSPLKGKVSFEQACEAIGGICAALEIIDSRFKGFKYFSLPDVIADNCSAAKFYWGSEITFDPTVDLAKVKMKLQVNGETVQEALGSEISGNPIHSLIQLAELLDRWDLEVPAGALVLAGAATPAVALAKGQLIKLTVDHLPVLEFKVEP